MIYVMFRSLEMYSGSAWHLSEKSVFQI